MKMVFAALYDPRDLARGSGSTHFLSRELERRVDELVCLAAPKVEKPWLTRLLTRFARARGQGYRGHQDPWAGRRAGTAFGERLAEEAPFDVLLTNDAALAAYTPTERPIVLYTDAIFPPRYRDNRHPWLENLSAPSVRACQTVHRRALSRVSLACVASRWAAEEARAYGASGGAPIVVIPYGANLDPPTAELGEKRRDRWRSAPTLPLELLFVGRDWRLKGGELAVAVRHELERRGIAARLHLVGVEPQGDVDRRGIVEHGLLDKAVAAEREKLAELYARCDLLLLPTRAEGFGIVFAEAAAFSLPSLACKTTGVETAVADGQSGILLALDADADAFADVIESWYRRPERYRQLVSGARQHYESTVNWPTAVARLCREIEAVL